MPHEKLSERSKCSSSSSSKASRTDVLLRTLPLGPAAGDPSSWTSSSTSSSSKFWKEPPRPWIKWSGPSSSSSSHFAAFPSAVNAVPRLAAAVPSSILFVGTVVIGVVVGIGIGYGACCRGVGAASRASLSQTLSLFLLCCAWTKRMFSLLQKRQQRIKEITVTAVATPSSAPYFILHPGLSENQSLWTPPCGIWNMAGGTLSTLPFSGIAR